MSIFSIKKDIDSIKEIKEEINNLNYKLKNNRQFIGVDDKKGIIRKIKELEKDKQDLKIIIAKCILDL